MLKYLWVGKKSFSMGVVIPHKKRNCDVCKQNVLCDECDKLANQKKEISANCHEVKREAPNEFGHMLPKFITIWMWYLYFSIR